MIKWILSLFRDKERMSEKWLVNQDIKEASEGWKDAPRWRFPAEIAEQKRLERRIKISLIREERERKRA